ncbi:unnamed protein product, partial [marine sediment metagenome]
MKTYPMSFRQAKERLPRFRDRIIYAIREAVRNMKQYCNSPAKGVCFCVSQGDCNYLVHAHNSKDILTSEEILTRALVPLESQGLPGSIRGCGLSISGLICSPQDIEHIIIGAKQEDDSWFIGQGCREDNEWKTKEKPSWGEYIPKWLGKYSEDYNVIYAFPFPKSEKVPLGVDVMNTVSLLVGDYLNSSIKLTYLTGNTLINEAVKNDEKQTSIVPFLSGNSGGSRRAVL